MQTAGSPSPWYLAFAWTGAAVFAASLVYFLYSYLIPFGRGAPAGSWLPPTLVDAGLFSAFAAHHSLLARTPARAFVRTIVPPVLERSCYAWTASLLFAGVCWMWQPVPGVLYGHEGVWWWMGAGLQLAGIVVIGLGSSTIDALELAGVRQVMQVRSGPDRERTQPLLRTTGVYGRVRHPIYFGWILLVFGAPVMTGTRLVFATISTAYVALAIPWEERDLVKTFGPAYDAYRRQVRWRLLPGVW